MAGEALGPLLADLRGLVEEDLASFRAALEALDAPHTRGRVPTWTIE